MTYREYTAKWKKAGESSSLTQLYSLFSDSSEESLLPPAASAFVFRTSEEKRRLSVSLVRQFHVLASYGSYDVKDALSPDISPPGIYKSKQGSGCPPDECEAVVSDFIQELHGFGRSNPLFYAAYIIGEFCRFQPFSYANLETALMLVNHFLLSRDLAPLIFQNNIKAQLDKNLQLYLKEENLQPLVLFVSEIAAQTSALIFP